MQPYNSNLAPCDGEVYWQPQFYAPQHADAVFTQLNTSCAWQAEKVLVFGKWHPVPRLMCWYGDTNAAYRYSGVSHQPLPWTPELLAIKQDLHTTATVNSTAYCSTCIATAKMPWATMPMMKMNWAKTQ